MVKKENVEKIKILVDKLPEPEKDRAVIFIEGRIFTWNEILEEFNKGGDLADKIENKLSEKIK